MGGVDFAPLVGHCEFVSMAEAPEGVAASLDGLAAQPGVTAGVDPGVTANLAEIGDGATTGAPAEPGVAATWSEASMGGNCPRICG